MTRQCLMFGRIQQEGAPPTQENSLPLQPTGAKIEFLSNLFRNARWPSHDATRVERTILPIAILAPLVAIRTVCLVSLLC